ncbi:tumor necrosis factor receptor superfamily member 6B-like [Glandiceps talaboti]
MAVSNHFPSGLIAGKHRAIFIVVLCAMIALVKCTSHYPRYTAINADEVVSRRVCSSCPPGTGVVKLCSGNKDTECQQCIGGTYSPHWSRTSVCQPCNPCLPLSTILRNCTRLQDFECSKKLNTVAHKVKTRQVVDPGYMPDLGVIEDASYTSNTTKSTSGHAMVLAVIISVTTLLVVLV